MSKKQSAKKTNFTKKIKKIWGIIWHVISWPFRKFAKLARAFWKWVCKIDIVGLTNTALLVAIITLFSMLIMDLIEHNRTQVIITPASKLIKPQVIITDQSSPKIIKLPLSKNTKTGTKKQTVDNVVPVSKKELQIVKKQTAKLNNTLMGDTIIDSRGSGALLKNIKEVNGNLYLQNMRKYVLPCDIRINGNLFLRDVNKLQFCGDFTITGNIYVSPKSSFGPIPKTARLGGHVIL